MSRVEVRSIQALEELRAALLRFGAEAEAALHSMDVQVQQTLAYLEERRRYWETKVRAAQEEYERARAALIKCQSQRRVDPKSGRTDVPSCSQEQEWVLCASQALAKAQACLREVLERRRLVERSVEEYRHRASRMVEWIRRDLPKATALLNSQVNSLYAYIRDGASSSATSAGLSFSTTTSQAQIADGMSARATRAPVDVASSVGARGILMAMAGGGVLSVAVIRWLSQGWRKLLGDVGETLAADLVRREGNLREISFDQPKHGFDRVFLSPDGQVVILESKVHKHGEFHPGQTRAGEQGSPEWIAATADRMADPSSAQWSPANERIAALIREIGPEHVPVIGVVIETATGRANIYHRQGNEDWVLLQQDVSLAEVLSTDADVQRSSTIRLEHERSPEQEISLGGVERLG